MVDRNLQKLAATTNYVSKTDPPLLLLIRFNPGGNRRKFANCQKSDTQIPTAARKKCGFVDFARSKLPSPPLSRLAGVYECGQCLLVIGMRQKQSMQDSLNKFDISCNNYLVPTIWTLETSAQIFGLIGSKACQQFIHNT